MGLRNQKQPAFTNTIKRLFFEVNKVDGDRRLRLVLEREGSQYPDWYSCGTLPEDSTFKLNKKGTTWTPADHAFNSRSMAMWFLNGLMDELEKAGVEFNDEDLESFWGMKVRTENKVYKTKVQGQNIEREKPFVVGIPDGEDGATSAASRTGTSTGTGSAAPSDELVETLKTLLEANEGEIEVAAITAKSLKGVVDADYATRKSIAAQLTADGALDGIEEVTVTDGVIALA